MDLFYRETGTGEPIVILHGLFGSSDNWLSIAKVLAENHQVYSVDQRNHGQSPHHEEFSYPVMAQDLKDFLDQNNIQNPIIIGHSMGGKVAMEFATDHPDKLQKLIVVDIAPKEYPVHHDTILSGLCELPVSKLKSRGEADKLLAAYIPEQGVRQFLLKNLTRASEGFTWKINLPVIKDNIEIIGHGLSEEATFDKPTLFIDGQNSNYISDEDTPLIRKHFPLADIRTIQNAGHWVHAEQPGEFLRLVRAFI